MLIPHFLCGGRQKPSKASEESTSKTLTTLMVKQHAGRCKAHTDRTYSWKKAYSRAQTAQLVENNDKTPEMVTQRSIFLTTRQNNWNEKYPTPQRGGGPAVGLLRVCAWWWVFLLRSSNALCKSWLGRKPRCDIWGILLSHAPESGARGVSTWRIIMSEGRRIASFFFWGRTKPEKKWIEVAHCAPPLSLLELVVSAVGLLTA